MRVGRRKVLEFMKTKKLITQGSLMVQEGRTPPMKIVDVGPEAMASLAVETMAFFHAGGEVAKWAVVCDLGVVNILKLKQYGEILAETIVLAESTMRGLCDSGEDVTLRWDDKELKLGSVITATLHTTWRTEEVAFKTLKGTDIFRFKDDAPTTERMRISLEPLGSERGGFCVVVSTDHGKRGEGCPVPYDEVVLKIVR